MVHFILLDGSYYCFYRYHALINYFKLRFKEEDISNPAENSLFLEKWRDIFVKKIKEISNKLKIKDPYIIVGKDCSRKNIWRNKFIDNYKATRDYSNFNGGPLFKIAWDEDLFIKAGCKQILYHENLEADDCLAIAVKKIKDKYPDAKTTIITGDMDYLQLISPNVFIKNLRFKDLATEKNSMGSPSKDLLLKIIMGDKSDNISSIFPKCGKVTAKKLLNNPDLLKEKLNDPTIYKKYMINKKIISFKEIPKDLQEIIYTSFNI